MATGSKKTFLTVDPERLNRISIPVSTGWLLSSVMEARGKQELWTQRKPEVLNALREQAVVQSVESSNRIEGVTVARDRLRPIILEGAKPIDRSEEELVGYKLALNRIFTTEKPISVSLTTILNLHELAQGGFSGDAGKLKSRDNEIIEILSNGERRVRFVPTSARETPATLERLCQSYNLVVREERVPILLAIAAFVLDFLCIHPFRDGNGRVSRLLTTLLLHQNYFVVGRYISLERLIEDTKQDYYRTLEQCSVGWHDGTNDPLSWFNYFLSTLRRAYTEFERQVESADTGAAKTDIVRAVVLEQIGEFTLADIAARCPAVSTQQIKKTLSAMKDEGAVQLNGRGRGARWNLTQTKR